MKIYCPHCKSPVGSPPIKPADGYLKCHNCGQSFRIISALEQAPEIHRVRREPEFRSGIVTTADGVTFFFRGKKPVVSLLLYIVVGLCLAIYAVVKDQEGIGLRITTAFFAFISFFSFFLMLFWKEELQIRANAVSYTKTRFGFRNIKIHPRIQFSRIYEDVEYDSYNKPSFCLRMEFKNGESFRFGLNLTHNERVWLIGEMEAAVKGERISKT
jgi:hypothetical protein